jgi:hypothetical protein
MRTNSKKNASKFQGFHHIQRALRRVLIVVKFRHPKQRKQLHRSVMQLRIDKNII